METLLLVACILKLHLWRNDHDCSLHGFILLSMNDKTFESVILDITRSSVAHLRCVGWLMWCAYSLVCNRLIKFLGRRRFGLSTWMLKSSAIMIGRPLSFAESWRNFDNSLKKDRVAFSVLYILQMRIFWILFLIFASISSKVLYPSDLNRSRVSCFLKIKHTPPPLDLFFLICKSRFFNYFELSPSSVLNQVSCIAQISVEESFRYSSTFTSLLQMDWALKQFNMVKFFTSESLSIASFLVLSQCYDLKKSLQPQLEGRHVIQHGVNLLVSQFLLLWPFCS